MRGNEEERMCGSEQYRLMSSSRNTRRTAASWWTFVPRSLSLLLKFDEVTSSAPRDHRPILWTLSGFGTITVLQIWLWWFKDQKNRLKRFSADSSDTFKPRPPRPGHVPEPCLRFGHPEIIMWPPKSLDLNVNILINDSSETSLNFSANKNGPPI